MEKKKIPLVDQYPKSSIEVMEIVMYGMTLEERNKERDAERDKKMNTSNILRLYNLGLLPTKIAEGLALDIDYVEEVLEEHLKN